VPTIYTRSILIPEYGIEIDLTRKRGQRWWVVAAGDAPARKRTPRGAVAVKAYALTERTQTRTRRKASAAPP